ncbi:MAG TPA: class I SAM-dependent methyltransferase [Candidatus Polarisedimenticolaceae bacterium]|nr:class I SAM-dependent methyltransferase [Candidatus Polarisedimenticolaceae bacterium]
MASTERPDYGIDAPDVVRNLALCGGACLIVAVLGLTQVIPRVLSFGGVRIAVVPPMLSAGLALVASALGMLYGSKFGKVGEREKLLGRIDWRGDERVLDVGCGRGLVLVGARKRLATGFAIGIDIWQAEDLSGNRPDVPLENARREGVADRIGVLTADMRAMPFAAGAFDVVVSRAVIHNLYDARHREAAIREVARILKPGGRAVISDIRHHGEYRKTFEAAGCPDVRLLDSKAASLFWTLFTFGSLRPNTMLVTKAG